MMAVITLLKRVVIGFLSKLGYRLTKLSVPTRSGTNLNVGSGGYELKNFISLDFLSEHYYKSEKFNGVHFDMRSDSLPFDSNSVDSIYCSHVIEHIETKHVFNFFQDAYRVLKPEGTLRIVCPDSLLLYKAVISFPSFFAWHPSFDTTKDAMYCFVDEVATHRIELDNYGLTKPFDDYEYDELMEELRLGGEFDSEKPGRHINNWDYQRVSNLGRRAGFQAIIQSQFRGSFSPSLQGDDIDMTHPEMSLYVDLRK